MLGRFSQRDSNHAHAHSLLDSSLTVGFRVGSAVSRNMLNKRAIRTPAAIEDAADSGLRRASYLKMGAESRVVSLPAMTVVGEARERGADTAFCTSTATVSLSAARIVAVALAFSNGAVYSCRLACSKGLHVRGSKRLAPDRPVPASKLVDSDPDR